MPTPIPTAQHPILKSLINETYTDGVESILDARLEDDGAIIAVASDEDRIVAFKYTDAQVSVRVLNPEVIEGESEDEAPDDSAAVREDKKCSKGIPCGASCISKRKVCRKKLAGATLAKGKKAAKPKKVANSVERLNKALDAQDFDEAAKVADEIYEAAKQRAKKAGGDFYEGITAGNSSVEDWIMQELYAQRGYDKKPKKVKSDAIDNAYKNDRTVGYRAMGSSPQRFHQHFSNFKDGDYFAGHGIYGHGTYVAYAQRGGTHSRQTAVNAASPYGSGVMRIALAKNARIVDQSDHMQDVMGMQLRIEGWYKQTRDKKAYRRLKRVAIGDVVPGNDTSGRLAVIQGVDAIRLNQAYDPTYMNLLNRSKVSVQGLPGNLYVE